MATKRAFSNKIHHSGDILIGFGFLLWLSWNAFSLLWEQNLVFVENPLPSEVPQNNFCFTDGPCVPQEVAESLKNVHFPSAIIFGAKKSGTRALLQILSSHPRINALQNEGHFFDKDDSYFLGNHWYKSQMPCSENDDEIVIEKTPSYIFSTIAPKRLFAFNPNIKLIAILRNPVDRLLSDYTQVQSRRASYNLPPYPQFPQWVFDKDNVTIRKRTPVTVGKYSVHLKEWFKYFPRSQFLFLDGSKFIRDPVTSLKNVETFLNISPFFNNGNVYYNHTRGFHCWLKQGYPTCLGSEKGRTPPIITKAQRQLIWTYYKPYNEELFAMIGQSFKWDS